MAEAPPKNGINRAYSIAMLIATCIAIIAAVSSYFNSQGVSSATVATIQNNQQNITSRLDNLDGKIQTLDIQYSVRLADDCEQFAKIETQVGQIEAILNKDNIEYIRWKSGIDEKIFGIAPPGVYYSIQIPHEVMPCNFK